MPENAIIPDGAIPDKEAVPETAKEKFERERLSRRQALKKLGMTSAMATFALFSVDDLAHMVGRAMQQRAGDNKVAAQVAKELQQAGVVLAWGDTGSTCWALGQSFNCAGCGAGGATQGTCCSHTTNQNKCCGETFGIGGTNPDSQRLQTCCQVAYGGTPSDAYQACLAQAIPLAPA